MNIALEKTVQCPVEQKPFAAATRRLVEVLSEGGRGLGFDISVDPVRTYWLDADSEMDPVRGGPRTHGAFNGQSWRLLEQQDNRGRRQHLLLTPPARNQIVMVWVYGSGAPSASWARGRVSLAFVPIRIEFPGAVYQVTSRVDRQAAADAGAGHRQHRCDAVIAPLPRHRRRARPPARVLGHLADGAGAVTRCQALIWLPFRPSVWRGNAVHQRSRFQVEQFSVLDAEDPWSDPLDAGRQDRTFRASRHKAPSRGGPRDPIYKGGR